MTIFFIYINVCPFFQYKGWVAIAKLTPTFTFLDRDFTIFYTLYGKIPTKKVKVGFSFAMDTQPFDHPAQIIGCTLNSVQ